MRKEIPKVDTQRDSPNHQEIGGEPLLAYGMSEFKLAGTLGITVKEAKALIREYFRAFPLIERTLKFLGDFGVRNGFIQNLAPFFRKRWFPFWREWAPYIDPHLSGSKFIPKLGEIERASKNMPIQGSAADMMKIAMILARNYIKEHNLWNTVKLVAQVHDQLTTICVKEYAEEWKVILDRLMCEAGMVIIPTGLIKAETQITDCWTK